MSRCRRTRRFKGTPGVRSIENELRCYGLVSAGSGVRVCVNSQDRDRRHSYDLFGDTA
jgi:hypothetical protein